MEGREEDDGEGDATASIGLAVARSREDVQLMKGRDDTFSCGGGSVEISFFGGAVLTSRWRSHWCPFSVQSSAPLEEADDSEEVEDVDDSERS